MNEKKLNRKRMLEAIEAHHWDYEDSIVYPGVEQVQEPGLLMRKIAGSNSTNANWVMRFAFSEAEAEAQIERWGIRTRFCAKWVLWSMKCLRLARFIAGKNRTML